MKKKQPADKTIQLRSSLRYLRCKDPDRLRKTEIFLRTFLDKKTRLIKVEHVLGTMLSLGLKHEHEVVKEYFEHYPFRVEGHLSEEEYLRVIDRLDANTTGTMSKQDQQVIFEFFSREGGDGIITAGKLVEVAGGLGLSLELDMAECMIRSFARNSEFMDKRDFASMMAGQTHRQIKSRK